MDKDNNIQKELEELSPLLARMKDKKETVKIPDNYFHYLENSVMQQVQLENRPVLQINKRESISLWSRFFSGRLIVGFASVVLLVLAGVYFNQMGGDISDNSLQLADLTDAEIFNYLTDNAEVLDIYSLSEFEDDVSILDMIDLEEGELDYFFEESSTDILSEELF